MPRLAAHPSRRLPLHALRSLAIRREVMACTANQVPSPAQASTRFTRIGAEPKVVSATNDSRHFDRHQFPAASASLAEPCSSRLPEVTGTDQERRRTVAFRASLRTIGVESHAFAIATGLLFAANLEHPDVTDTVRLLKDLPFEVLVASIPDIELTMRLILVISSASPPGAFDIYHAEHIPARI